MGTIAKLSDRVVEMGDVFGLGWGKSPSDDPVILSNRISILAAHVHELDVSVTEMRLMVDHVLEEGETVKTLGDLVRQTNELAADVRLTGGLSPESGFVAIRACLERIEDHVESIQGRLEAISNSLDDLEEEDDDGDEYEEDEADEEEDEEETEEYAVDDERRNRIDLLGEDF